ncbi:NTP transferase domain-containing protein [Rhodococcoides yunnanense]|uniref:NTP transferase domain-containing protein n=1 Tax=Rhodococcoides yunnanense TaxID=278209 RepID=UPI000933216C|nr:NTP transferase domain-containing protein [Rhodococcus yunnanensis]
MDFDAVVLAGGSARRMGGIDKPGLSVGGTTLVQRAVDAVAAARSIVVVGPDRDLGPNVLQTRESPAGSGPVAAIAAGLNALAPPHADVVVVLAADLPFVSSGAIDLLLAARGIAPVVFASDSHGRSQHLFAAWGRETLVSAIAALGAAEGRSVRSLVPTESTVVAMTDVDDCDTPDDLRRARERAALGATGIDFARSAIRERVAPIAVRHVAPIGSEGAVLAEPVIAAAPLPHVDTSAMDGYAICGDEPWTLRDDVAYAGTSGLLDLLPGDAVRIATGARIPSGASSVVRDEHIHRGDDGLLRRRPAAPVRDDSRRSGEDWETGTELVTAGTHISAAVVSVALSAEVRELAVRGPVRARTVSSGNEIRVSGQLEAGQTRDSIGPILSRYLRSCGITETDSVHLADTSTAFDELLAASTDVDLVIVVGATGAGAADQLRAALSRAGADTLVDRVPIRPGGSQITAVLPSGVVVIGLPGNPLAAVSTLLLIAPAVVDALTQRTPVAPWLGRLTNAADVESDTARIIPVVRDGAGWRADTAVRTAHLLHLVGHDALAVVPPHLSSDALVELLPLTR